MSELFLPDTFSLFLQSRRFSRYVFCQDYCKIEKFNKINIIGFTEHIMITQDFFSAIENCNVLIIGDVMMDAYIFGKVERISPEAPVPVVSVLKRDNRVGGAANVAVNVKSLGATPFLCSVIGNDDKGQQIIDVMLENGLPVDGIIQDSSRQTTTKFRIIGNNTQMLRVDEEITTQLGPEATQNLIHSVRQIIEKQTIQCIIFQDYDKGVITQALIFDVVKIAKENNIPVAVDPKQRNFKAFQNVTLFKPNLKEFAEGMKLDVLPEENEALAEMMTDYAKKKNIQNIMVTMGEKGILTVSARDKSYYHIPAHLRQISDVSGAGDTVISVAGLCLAVGMDALQTTVLSNLAGGLVCQYVGVVPLKKDEFINEIERLQIFR
jgi:D-glycero-beta-D-manno-heptose-7-phosphate kinase